MRSRRLTVTAVVLGSVLLCLGFREFASFNNKKLPDSVQKQLVEAEQENTQRVRRIEDVCYKYNLGLYRYKDDPPKIKHPPAPQYGVFYIDRKHNISWCPIYKAASTTWLHHFLSLAGYSEEEVLNSHKQLSEIARMAYPELEFEEAEEDPVICGRVVLSCIKSIVLGLSIMEVERSLVLLLCWSNKLKAFLVTLKLLVVRHPFTRLLSAYRDKLENVQTGAEHGTKHYYLRYGRHIVARYREGGNSTHTMSVLKPGQYLQDSTSPKPAGTEPTFEEFVRYLLDIDLTQRADDHWIPYYLYCTPCLLKYDVVAKVETMDRDQLFTLHKAGLLGLIEPQWRHRAATGGGSEADKRYFSQLSKHQVQQLYNKYWLDFELFGYSPELYLKYTKDFNKF